MNVVVKICDDVWFRHGNVSFGHCPMFVRVRNLGSWIRLGQKEHVQCLFMYEIREDGSVSVRRNMSNVCSCTKFGKLDPSRSEGRCTCEIRGSELD
jgi:hypothetical protein